MFLLFFLRKYRLVLFISLLLFIIPFFWFKPGEMDLGGDGNRLYFYDPLNFLKNVVFYSIDSEGKGNVEQRHAYLIYVGFIALIKYFINSPHLLISIFNGIKLSVGFLSIYFIVKEFIQHLSPQKKGARFIKGDSREDKNILSVELSAIIAGVFYVVATGSEKLIFLWVKALHSHDQVFLNPLIFFLLLRFLLTKKSRYLWMFLFVSFIFSTNFSMISSPPFFAFYPITLFFLLLYIVLIRKIKIPIKQIIVSLFLFLGLHSFHLIPEIATLLDSGSIVNSIVFKESVNGGLNYFLAVLGLGKASISLFVPTPEVFLRWTSFIPPLVIILGFLLRRKINKEILLTSLFFLITLFLVTANITHLGVWIYSKLFYIPGFSMFRNFYTQWAYVFIFFYALLFGQSLSVIFTRLRPAYAKISAFIILLFFIVGFWTFLNGKLVDGIQWGSKGVKTAIIMDLRYEQTLEFISKLPDEGKMLILPLTDNFNQVVYGLNNAAYVGPSSISILTSKKSFSGYQIFYPNPIPENIMRFSREKNYEALSQIFSLFNIRYIFHNADPKAYEEKFLNIFPYGYMMTSLPKSQKEYKRFVEKFPTKLIYENGPFNIFEFDKKVYRSEVYVSDSIYQDDMIQTISNQKVSYRSAFIDKDVCRKNEAVSDFCKAEYKPPNAEITVKKINPVQYLIRIKQSEGTSPFLLVFQNSYHKDWKLSFEKNPPLSEEKHVLVNKYANAWIITEDDRKGKTDYVLTLNLQTQRYFQYGLLVTGLSLFIFLVQVVKTAVRKKN